MDDIDSGFKATTGLRNAFPLPCHVYIKDGSGIAFHKTVFFSQMMKLKNLGKRFLKAKEELK